MHKMALLQNRDYPQLTTEGMKRFISFTEEITEIMPRLSQNNQSPNGIVDNH
jgi:hypothetical protein